LVIAVIRHFRMLFFLLNCRIMKDKCLYQRDPLSNRLSRPKPSWKLLSPYLAKKLLTTIRTIFSIKHWFIDLPTINRPLTYASCKSCES
jgi:hypothetical protein